MINLKIKKVSVILKIVYEEFKLLVFYLISGTRIGEQWFFFWIMTVALIN